MKTARGGATEREQLIRVWRRMGYSQRESERLAREDERVSAEWRDQGMSQANVTRALASLRAVRDLFVVDARGRLKPAPMGPSILDVTRAKRTKRKTTPQPKKGAE